MLSQNWSAQAGIRDCYNSTQLIQAAAKEANTQAPLIEVCGSLYRRAIESGLGEEDMISVVKCLAGKEGLRNPSDSSE
jgi:3-hydroxyisobutyrate dehydrogenase-like beta-hydroxyacid dehydrogenase